MAYADQSMSGNKIVAIIIVGLIHLLVGYALVTGLAYSAVQKAIERVTTVNIEEPEPEDEPPPPPPDEKPAVPPPVVPPPPIMINVAPPPPTRTLDESPPIQQPVIREVPRETAPVAVAPPKVDKSKRLSPKNQSRWSARIQENYPSRAVRSGTEGTVGVSVTVGPDGKVSACSVSSSSGSDVLDSAACDGMRRYAQFDPALDEDGRPTSAGWSTRIVYRLN